MAPPLTPEEEAEAAAIRAEALGTEAERRRELRDLTLAQLQYLESMPTTYTEISSAVASLTAQVERNLNLLRDTLRQYQEIAEDTTKSSRARAAAELSAKQAEIDLYQELVRQGTATRAELESIKTQFEELEENVNKAEKASAELFNVFSSLVRGDIVGGLKQLGSTMFKTFATSKIDKFKDSLFEVSRKAIGGSGGAIAALGGLSAAAVAFGGALFITKQIIELAISVENLSREIQKATGLSKDFTNEIMANADAVRAFDPQMKMLGDTTQALNKSFTDFSMLNKEAAANVAVTLTALNALGIGAADMSKGMQISTKALGENAEQAAQTQLELNALARDIGVAPADMAANFANAGSHLAKLGRDGVKAFKDLAVASKITGIEVGRLLAITERFDTFEGAAEQAGKLNAALGGNFVNAMELLTATDPVERFEMIRNSILDAGLSFDSMSYFQRRFYAESMGLQDVSELAAVMSGNMSALSGEIGKTASDYENAAKMAADFQSVQDQIKNALHALIPVVQPLAEFIGDLASKISEFVTQNKELLRSVGYGLLIALSAVGVVLTILAGKFIAIAGAVGVVVTAIGALIDVMLHKRNSPTFFESLLETANRFDKLSGSTKKFAVEAETTSTSVDKMRNSMSQATANRAGAQTIANNNVMSNAINNAVSNTTNNYGQQASQNIVIELDGKKVGEGVMGKFARNAAMV